MMGTTQWPDIKVRATIQDDTAAGAKSAQKNMDQLLNQQKAQREGTKARSRDRSRVRDETASATLDLEAETNASILRKNGEFYEADRVLRERAYKREIADIKKQAQARIAANQDAEVAVLKNADVATKRATLKHRDTEEKSRSDELEAVKKRYWDRVNKMKGGGDGGEGGGGHGKGAFGRIFSDQKTTGMGPLLRGATEAVSEHLGTGLALGGVAVVGQVLSDVTDKAVLFVDKLHDGNENAADIALDLGKGVPILGGWVSAGANINEAFTHTKRDCSIIDETTAHIVSLNDQWLSLAQRVGQEKREQSRELAKDDRQIAAVGLRGIEAQRQAIVDKYKDQQDANDKAREDAKIAATKDPALKAAQEAREKFDKAHGNGKMKGALGDEKDALDAQYKKAQQKVNEERDNKLNFLDADDGKKAIQKKKELEEQNKLYAEGLEIQSEQADADNAQAKGSSTADTARRGGHIADAAKQRIQTSIESEKTAAKIAAEGRTNATTDVRERAIIAKQLQDKLAAIDEKGKGELAQADKEAGTERKRAVYDTSEATADAQASAKAQALREAGKGYDAERVMRERELRRAKDDIDQGAEEKIAQNKDNEKDIRAKAAAEKGKLDSDYQEKDRQAKEGEIAGRVDTAKDLIGGRIEALKSEASVGNIAAAAEAKRLEIANQFMARRAEINKMIRDPNVSAAEKELAKQQLAGLDAQQQRAEQMAMFTGGAATPGLNISQRGSGAITKAQEENSPFIMLQKQNAKNGETLAGIKTASEALLKIFNKNPIIVDLLGNS